MKLMRHDAFTGVSKKQGKRREPERERKIDNCLECCDGIIRAQSSRKGSGRIRASGQSDPSLFQACSKLVPSCSHSPDVQYHIVHFFGTVSGSQEMGMGPHGNANCAAGHIAATPQGMRLHRLFVVANMCNTLLYSHTGLSSVPRLPLRLAPRPFNCKWRS